MSRRYHVTQRYVEVSLATARSSNAVYGSAAGGSLMYNYDPNEDQHQRHVINTVLFGHATHQCRGRGVARVPLSISMHR